MIVLNVDASSKMCRRWQGPATVIKVKSPHSYLVDMGDGRVRHVHANKMRKFHIRVQGCNVISEADSDFGRVIAPVNVSENVLPSVNVDCDKLTKYLPIPVTKFSITRTIECAVSNVRNRVVYRLVLNIQM